MASKIEQEEQSLLKVEAPKSLKEIDGKKLNEQTIPKYRSKARIPQR